MNFLQSENTVLYFWRAQHNPAVSLWYLSALLYCYSDLLSLYVSQKQAAPFLRHFSSSENEHFQFHTFIS